VDVGLINVVATVTDSRGDYVEDLTAEDFVLEEDGQVQTITHLTQSNDLPVSVGIVLDSSESMERKISTASDAVEQFIRTIHKNDDIFLMTFDRRPQLRQDFTDNRDKLASALRKVKLGLGTALYDAVDDSLQKVKHGKQDKRAILLITDGEDTSSSIDVEDALLRVRQSNVLLYALGISPNGFDSTTSRNPGRTTPPVIGPQGGGRRGGVVVPNLPIPIPIPGRRLEFQQGPQRQGGGLLRDSVNMKVLNELADVSGGKAWLVSGSRNGRDNDIERALDEIAAELRNQYSLGYYPSHAINDGKWHRIRIRMKSSNYKVRFRGDYFGG